MPLFYTKRSGPAFGPRSVLLKRLANSGPTAALCGLDGG